MLRRLSRAISLPQSKPKTTQRSESPPPKRSSSTLSATKAAVLIEASTQSVPITAEAAIQAGNQGVLGVDVFGAPAPAPPAARQLFANTSAELGGDSGRHSHSNKLHSAELGGPDMPDLLRGELVAPKLVFSLNEEMDAPAEIEAESSDEEEDAEPLSSVPEETKAVEDDLTRTETLFASIRRGSRRRRSVRRPLASL